MADKKKSSKPGPRYQRILLKLSGEAGVGGDSFGIDPKTLAAVSEEIAQVVKAQVQVCVVVGGGNIFRGAALAEAGGKNHHPALFQMSQRAAPDVGFTDRVHRDR